MAPDEGGAEPSHEEERDELIIGALAAAGDQINELAEEARELKVAASNRRKDDRRRDIMLAILCVLLGLGLIGQWQAWVQRSDIAAEQKAGSERGENIESLLETVNGCINPAEGEEPDCGQDSSNGSAAAQAVTAINHYTLDLAYCHAGGVVADELEACAAQRQIERQGEDGGQLPPGP